MSTCPYLAAALALLVAFPVCAANKKTAARKTAKPAAVAKPAASAQSAHRKSPYVGAIAADAKTGKVLFAANENAEAYPASVTKLMTALLVLEDISAGRYAMKDRVVATPEVYKCEPSAVGIRAGQSMSVEDLLLALMVKSANDAAIALAVKSAGSHAAFVTKMNAKAKALGMTRTVYYNANGLQAPKWAPRNNVSTCRDLLKLARVLLSEHSEILRFTSVKIGEVTDGAGKPLKFVNHNNVMVKDKLKIINPDGGEAVDGLKTGYITEGGSSVILTGRRNGKRVVAVVLGSASTKERDENATRILNDALSAVAW